MKLNFTLIISLFAVQSLLSQDLVRSDYQFTVLFNSHNPTLIDVDKMSDLLANSNNLKPNDINLFTQRTNVASEFGLGNALYVFSRAKSGKNEDGLPNHLLKRRLALSIQSQSTFETSYQRSFNKDSITTINQEYFIRGRQTLISGEYSFIHGTKPDKWITFFAGYGASVGFSLISKFEEILNTRTTISTSAGGTSNFISQVEQLNGKMNVALSVFAPLGMHIQAYKNLGILTEARVGGNLLQSLGNATSIKPVFMFGIGLRYSFGKYLERPTEEELLY
jgi:hypothetical protein